MLIGGLQYPSFLEQHANQIIFIAEHKIINFNSWEAFVQTEEQDVKVGSGLNLLLCMNISSKFDFIN